MSGVPSVSIDEARGAIALPSDLDQTCVILGCTSAGSGLSPFYANETAAIAGVGYGDAVDVGTQILARDQIPVAFYTTPATTPGSYGTVDESGITGDGTVAMDASVHPLGTYEAAIYVVDAFVVGVAGGTIRWSLDGGRNRSRIIALGTATSYTIPSVGVKFEFSPSGIDLTALNTLLNEIKTDFNAHAILTTGGVHGASDAADVVATANASNTATRIALANALRAAYELHRIKTAGGVHGAADATNVITKPAATDDTSALVLAIELKTRYELHRVKVSAATHGLADSTNAVTSPDPDAGTFNAGDFATVRTVAPKWSTDDLDDAFTALKVNAIDFALLAVSGPLSAAEAEHVKTGVALLRSVGKRVTWIGETRMPDFGASETEAAWMASIEADYASYDDDNGHVRATYGIMTDAVTSRQYLRPDTAEFMADLVRVPRVVWPCSPNDRALEGVKLINSAGDLIGHDEGPMGNATGLSDDDQGHRFGCDFRGTEPAFRTSVYTCVPWTMYPNDGRIRNVMTRRVVNAIERTAAAVSFSALGGTTFYTPATGSTPAMLTESGRNRIHAGIFAKLAQDFGGSSPDIQNATDANPDTGLVQVQSEVTISGGNLVAVSVVIAPLVLGYLLSLSLTIAVQE